ncbi:MAG: hypothetical protein U9N30_09595 [Campylobacterota bacterium]|nr:hypothetical protein [Campylobacterota bacterium]
MQNPPINPNDMIMVTQHQTSSGSTFFAVAVLIVVSTFVIYTVILPKFKNSNK